MAKGSLAAVQISREYFLAVLLLCAALTASAQVAIPPLRAPVTDLTNTLTPQQIASLDQTLRAFEQRKGSQIAILLLPTTRPEAIEQFSIRLAEAWKIGREGIDDGVIIVLALQDREARIEVGYGLEGVLPDLIAARIIREDMAPHLRRDDTYFALTAAVDRVVRVIEDEPLPAPSAQRDARDDGGLGGVFPLLLMFVLVGGSILRRLFGSFLGAGATGGLAGLFMFLLTKIAGIAIVAGILAFIFSLFGGRGGGMLIGPGGWRSGGFGGGGFGGGWGGGGGFGGGGASGRW